MQIKPLTRRNRAGEIYQRFELVTVQIQDTLQLAPQHQLERIRISDPGSPNFLKEECLVYLIRDFSQRGEKAAVNGLAEVLVRRSARFIQSRLVSLEPDLAKNAYLDVIDALFEQILDLESDRGDFLQVRYWKALKRLTITVFRKYRNLATQLKQHISLAGVVFSDHSNGEVGDHNVASDEVLADPRPSVEYQLLSKELLQEGLGMIEESHRIAIILHYWEGWQIESTNPSEPTISDYFNVTPRTIRNWIRKAVEQLERWLQHEQP